MEPVKTPQQRQTEEEEEHEQEHEDMKAHKDPRCLKWVAGIVSLSYGRGYGLSSDWEQRPNYPPPREGVPPSTASARPYSFTKRAVYPRSGMVSSIGGELRTAHDILC
jgi:hypothetical protein